MENPFVRRATEYLRDDEAFLAMVTPEPVKAFLGEAGRNGELYDRLVLLSGTPGSGKTTLARLFEFPTLCALIRNPNSDSYRQLVATLDDCNALKELVPTVVGYRLPLESDYRDIWEFPYSDDLKLKLTTTLMQARTVLGWLRNLAAAGIDPNSIAIVPREDAGAAIEAIGGTQFRRVVERAREVEKTLYRIVASLIPPPLDELDLADADAYQPFDVIDRFRVPMVWGDAHRLIDVRPLAILDDAHVLQRDQFAGVRRWLSRRELRVSRWLLTRLDLLATRDVITALAEDRPHSGDLPGIIAARDHIEINLQSLNPERRERRAYFRRMAKDMADRYIRQMPLFSRRNLTRFGSLLETEVPTLPNSARATLRAEVDRIRHESRLSDARWQALLADVERYQPNDAQIGEDVHFAMLKVLIHRYIKRTPQLSLFDVRTDSEPSRPLQVGRDVYDAGRLHLLHAYSRPYYFGIDDLCDASSENAEQFLRLSASLIDAVEVQIVRNKRPSLSTTIQNNLLRQRATEFVDAWDFPHCEEVRRLTYGIAERCRAVSLEPNAPLGSGACAVGVPQREFEQIVERNRDLASILHFGIAYNAVNIIPRYECKGEEWCLVELGGLVLLRFGLTLKRGGFWEGSVRDLVRMVEGD